MRTNPFWLNKEFQVSSKELDMYQLPIDPFKPSPPDVTCKVWGQNDVLEVYEVQIVGGQFDGSRFYAGYGWLSKYITPDGGTK